MEAQSVDAVTATAQVRVTLKLGSESYSIGQDKGTLSEQLVSLKEESMKVLKDYITKHNVPTDVPDDLDEGSSGDDGEILEKAEVKSKKAKI